MVNVTRKVAKANTVKQTASRQRRPRNTELNSSMKATKSLAARRKLNSSKEAILEELRDWFTEEEAQEYVDSFEKQTGAKITRLATPEEVDNYDGDFWAIKDGKESLWCRGNDFWYEKADINSSETATEELNSSEDTSESTDEEIESESTVVTESGAEVALDDIAVVQNPDTNELALFIPEEDGEEIPKDFTVIGEVVPEGTVNSSRKINCSEEPADVITTESGNEVAVEDIVVVQNPDTNELSLFIPEDENAKIPDGVEVVGEVVAEGNLDASKKMNCNQHLKKRTELNSSSDAYIDTEGFLGERGDIWTTEELLEYWDYNQGKDPVLDQYDSYEDWVSETTTHLTPLDSSFVAGLNSDLGGGDDRQDATSQVTVPKSFPDDKVHDLYRWVESELWNEGIDIDVYGVGRPSAGVISFEYEVVGKTPAEVDAIIEDRVQEFVQNGYQGLQYPEGDPRHGLNSEKHEKSLNCKVENARVEPTEQGTWVVKADTDRFGKDAILYEHYSEEGANKYLDRLKAGGEAVANGYDGHIDPKLDLNSGDGTAEAKLDKASISKAMVKVLTEDKDTPLVYVKLKDGIQAYIQPAGYEDNQLVLNGNFDLAKIYVAIYDKDYKPIMVNGDVDTKMNGSEVVDFIKRYQG